MKLLQSAKGTCACAALVLAAFAGGSALAADAAGETTFHPPLLANWDAPLAGASSMQVAIDSQTGLLRPPTAMERIELAALAAPALGLRRSVARATVHADGSVSAALDPALFSATTVVVGADGQVHFSCGHAGDTAHLHPVTVTAPAAEDR